MNYFLTFLFIFAVSLIGSLVIYILNFNFDKNTKFITDKTIWYIIVFFCVYYTGLSCLNYQSFLTGGDLPIFVDIFENTIKGNFFLSTVERGSYNFLGHHFSPILISLVPLYAIWSGPKTLLIIQGIVFTLGAWPLYLLTRNKTESRFLAIAISTAYLLAPLQLEDLLTDFHMDYFIPAFILFSFYFLCRKKILSYSVFILLLLLCKEDSMIYAAGIGLYALFFQKQRKVGLLTIIFSLLYAGLTLGFLKPLLTGFSADIQHNWIGQRYARLGNDFKSFFSTILFHPIYVIKDFFEYNLQIKARSFCFILVPVGFLPILSGGALIMFIPAVMVMLLSSHWVINSLMYHYSVAIYAFTFIAAVFGSYRLIHIFKRQTSIRMTNACASFILIAGFLTHYHFSHWTPAKHFNFKPYFKHEKITDAYRIIEKVPPGESIAARDRYAAHLLGNHPMAVIKAHGNYIPTETEYILLDKQDRNSDDLFRILNEKKYGVFYLDDNFILLKNGYKVGQNNTAIQKLFGAEHEI